MGKKITHKYTTKDFGTWKYIPRNSKFGDSFIIEGAMAMNIDDNRILLMDADGTEYFVPISSIVSFTRIDIHELFKEAYNLI